MQTNTIEACFCCVVSNLFTNSVLAFTLQKGSPAISQLGGTLIVNENEFKKPGGAEPHHLEIGPQVRVTHNNCVMLLIPPSCF